MEQLNLAGNTVVKIGDFNVIANNFCNDVTNGNDDTCNVFEFSFISVKNDTEDYCYSFIYDIDSQLFRMSRVDFNSNDETIEYTHHKDIFKFEKNETNTDFLVSKMEQTKNGLIEKYASYEEISEIMGIDIETVKKGYYIVFDDELKLDVIQRIDSMVGFHLYDVEDDTQAGLKALKDGVSLFTISGIEELEGYYILCTDENITRLKELGYL